MSTENFSPRRVAAMVRRHLYVMRGSWPRLLEIIYWPVIGMFVWALLSTYLTQKNGVVAQTGIALIAGFLFWEIVFRGKFGIMFGVLEEFWARSMGYLFCTPLKVSEWITALTIVSAIKTFIGIGAASLAAMIFYQFSFNAFGFYLPLLLLNLCIFSWSFGLLVGAMIIRFGLSMESLAWASIFIISPITGIYYPVSILPEWLQHFSWLLPTTYVFESMRALLASSTFPSLWFYQALALNGLYYTLAVMAFYAAIRTARQRGTVLNTGE